MRVLLLATGHSDTVVDDVSNKVLPEALKERGATVDVQSWLDPNLTTDTLSTYTNVSFLWCNKYNDHFVAFVRFIKSVLIPAQERNTELAVMNDPSMVLWNANKTYLGELEDAGFCIPKTIFVDLPAQTLSSPKTLITELPGSCPLVLKPSISASSQLTYRLHDRQNLVAEDFVFLESIVAAENVSSLMVQDFEEGIMDGEYSLVFIDGEHTHTFLKRPSANDFRVGSTFGGKFSGVEKTNVPCNALEVASKIYKYLGKRFDGLTQDTAGIEKRMAYARIDGILRKDGVFVLMEVELIEPHLWLETPIGARGLERYCQAVFRS